MVVFGGSVTALIPLYTVGVFIAFTLSQAGMRAPPLAPAGAGLAWRIAVSGRGAVATGGVAIVVGVTKFALGAWMVLVLIPLLVLLLLSIRRHYHLARDQLAVTERGPAHPPRPRPPPAAARRRHPRRRPQPGGGARRGLRPLRSPPRAAPRTTWAPRASRRGPIWWPSTSRTTSRRASALKERWDRAGLGVDLVVLESPYRALVGPLLAYVNALERQQPEVTSVVTVLLPEYIPAHWWEHVLHTQTALRLKGALLFRPRTAVLSVPYHLAD